MPDNPMITHPLLRLGRLALGPGLRELAPASEGADPVVTAAVAVPDSPTSESYAWDVAWADAARQAGQLGADPATARALESGAGGVTAGGVRLGAGITTAGGVRVVIAAHGEMVLGWSLLSGVDAGWVRAGPLPHLTEVANDAARRPPYVVVLADREGTDIIAHGAADQAPARRFEVGDRPGLQPDPHPGRPPAQPHGERHVTDREPESGGQRNDEFIAGRVADAANSVAAHIVIGAGDQHILDAVAGHLPETIGPVTAIAGGRAADGRDDHLAGEISAALAGITGAAIGAVGDLVASLAEGPDPGAVRGIKAVAEQLAEQQVGVLLVAADVARDAGPGSGYRIGSRPTEFLVGEPDIGVEVPLEDGLVWAALHQDAIVVQLPDRGGLLAGEPVAALLRRGVAE
jgi:Bacterial archaeo-eukaryotic release factor family 2